MILPLYQYRLWFLISIVAVWYHAAFASTDSSANLCSNRYLIEPEQKFITNSAMLFHAFDLTTMQKVMIKVFRTKFDYRREMTLFDELNWRINAHSLDTETHVIDPRKREASWSHFVRLLHKCDYWGRSALVIELLDDVLWDAIRRSNCVPAKRSRRSASSDITSSTASATETHRFNGVGSNDISRSNSLLGKRSSAASDAASSMASASKIVRLNPSDSLDTYVETVSTAEEQLHGLIPVPTSSSVEAVPNPPPITLVLAAFLKSYAYQLLVAVDVLHQLGVYHLDLKPQNVGLTTDGALKLFDFGVSSTRAGPINYVGTIVYSAPEMNLRLFQLIKQTNQAGKLDVWSAGCTIYEIFTGQYFSDGINAFSECAKSEATNAQGQKRRSCGKDGAYFYLKWSFGSPAPTEEFAAEYEAAESSALDRCPHILAKCVPKLKTRSPLIFHHANIDESHIVAGQGTAIEQKMQEISSDLSLRATYLYPSFTEPTEVVELLSNLLRFHFHERITEREALTKCSIFSHLHQDITQSKLVDNTESSKRRQ